MNPSWKKFKLLVCVSLCYIIIKLDVEQIVPFWLDMGWSWVYKDLGYSTQKASLLGWCPKSLQVVSEPCPELSRVCRQVFNPSGRKQLSEVLEKLIGLLRILQQNPAPRKACRSLTRWRGTAVCVSHKACRPNTVNKISMEHMVFQVWRKMSLQRYSLFEGGLLSWMSNK